MPNRQPSDDLSTRPFGRTEPVEFGGAPFLFVSEAMQGLMDRARRMAGTGSTILITGESGCGKELIARSIHQFSGARGPFVDVNCAAFPEHLIESELFGYERGAFSGAEAMKPGLFEVAQGGTLFLDEIGELDMRMQAKLLRVLDGQPWFRLGGGRKVQVECRIVAATNLALEDAVLKGRFRIDLFHRLNVFRLEIPPLRERPADLEPLIGLFLQKTGKTVSPAALAILRNWQWPGNVRELKNVLAQAALFAGGVEIEPGDLPPELTTKRETAAATDFSLEVLERRTILKVLELTRSHQQRAAELLGISRRTLIRKLKAYREAGLLASSGPSLRHDEEMVA